jgi:hypothetical protein
VAGILSASLYSAENKMASQQPSILVIDSRDAAVQGNYDSFTVVLKPAICGLTSARLLYANIPNPGGVAVISDVHLYWLLRIGEFGTPTRTANNQDGASFVIPVNSAQGFRTLHRAESDFGSVSLQQPAADIHRLTVDLMLPGGTRPSILEPWFFCLELKYA